MENTNENEIKLKLGKITMNNELLEEFFACVCEMREAQEQARCESNLSTFKLARALESECDAFIKKHKSEILKDNAPK